MILNYFPATEYAIMGPIVLLIVCLTGVMTFLALVMIKSGRRPSHRRSTTPGTQATAQQRAPSHLHMDRKKNE